MRPYLGPPWTDSCQIWCVRVFHHVLPKYGHENAEMQKKIKIYDVTLRYSIVGGFILFNTRPSRTISPMWNSPKRRHICPKQHLWIHSKKWQDKSKTLLQAIMLKKIKRRQNKEVLRPRHIITNWRNERWTNYKSFNTQQLSQRIE